jgi:hypothetical protein
MTGSPSIESAILGLGLLGLGVLWLLANLDALALLPALRLLWPSLLVVWGALELASALGRRGRRR